MAAPEVEIKSSGARRLHGQIVAGVFGASGILCFFVDGSYISNNMLVASLCILTAIIVFYLARRSWSKSVVMTISLDGVWYKDWKLPTIPWHHIGRVYTTGVRLRPLLRIDLHNAEHFFAELDESARKTLKGHPLVKGDHLLVPNGVLEFPISAISAAINGAARPQ